VGQCNWDFYAKQQNGKACYRLSFEV